MAKLFVPLLFVALMAGAVPDGHCGANVARIPIAVTQSYENGEYSKIDCKWGRRSAMNEQCTLVVSESHVEHGFAVDLKKYGYDFMSQDYRIFGTLRDNTFVFSLEVSCNDEDYKKAGMEPSACRIIFELVKNRLVATGVEISFGPNESRVTRKMR